MFYSDSEKRAALSLECSPESPGVYDFIAAVGMLWRVGWPEGMLEWLLADNSTLSERELVFAVIGEGWRERPLLIDVNACRK